MRDRHANPGRHSFGFGLGLGLLVCEVLLRSIAQAILSLVLHRQVLLLLEVLLLLLIRMHQPKPCDWWHR